MLWYLGVAGAIAVLVSAQFDWQLHDGFDDVHAQVVRVTPDNCNIQHVSDLHLANDSVSHKPDIKDFKVNPVLPNRTALLLLHNLALSRSFFYSFILQRAHDFREPGLLYTYLSAVADVSSSSYINASALYYAPNRSFTPSYKDFFNQTMPLYAPRVYRADDYNEPIHLERISTLNTFEADDLGALPIDTRSKNYSTEEYRINDWYHAWLPDNNVFLNRRHDDKTVYDVKIRHANNTNETFSFHGPPAPDEVPGPIKWTRPYFDCGRSNKWIFGASVPVVDRYPRHTQFVHIEYPTYVAVVVMELDFDRIDINQCPIGEGNPRPNRFAGTARCKQDSTMCEPLDGYGFRRGGYQCRCIPGYRLPNIVRRPYLGEIIERATRAEYNRLFDCEAIGFKMLLQQNWIHMNPWDRAQYMQEFNINPNATLFPEKNETHFNTSEYRDYLQEQQRYQRINHDYDEGEKEHREQVLSHFDFTNRMLRFIGEVKPKNCSKYDPARLTLRGDVSFGAEKQFENEAIMALRLANFISSFLQIVEPKEVFAELRLADSPLNYEQMMAEVISLLFGNMKLKGAGVFWDRNKFVNHTLLAPYAYRKEGITERRLFLEDLARLNGTEEVYLNKPWFKDLKARWATNFDDLEELWVKIKIRYNSTGMYSRKYERFPIKFRGAALRHGQWSAPFFDCHGFHKQWIVTYSAPFFGWDSLKHKLEFKGAVKVAMNLLELDVNQCPQKFYTSNAFKGSDKCDRKSSYCVPIQGRGFMAGGYKCECLQGYEYPYEGPDTYYDGQDVESEFERMVQNNVTKYDTLKCRVAAAAAHVAQFCIVCSLLLVVKWLTGSP